MCLLKKKTKKQNLGKRCVQLGEDLSYWSKDREVGYLLMAPASRGQRVKALDVYESAKNQASGDKKYSRVSYFNTNVSCH